MDVAELYTIPYKSLENGEHTLEFRFDDSLFAAYENTDIRHAQGRVGVTLLRSASMLELKVSIRGSVVVACDRCLDDCTVPVEFDGTLVVKFSDEVSDYDGEVMWLLPMEDEIDLKQYIYESIVLSLPYQRVHPEGECNPEMLERFRIVSDSELAAVEARAGAQEHDGGEWAKLAALKERLEAEGPQEEDGTPEK